MSTLMIVMGLLVVASAAIDALWTTLWPDGGAGPLTERASTIIWSAAHALAGTKRDWLLSIAGPFILSATVLMWIALLAAGWLLVFGAEAQAVLNARTLQPADLTGRIWFVFYTMFTLGNGDFIPNGGAYQIAGAATVASGMILITLAITYVLSVISAIVQKRSFASQVSSFGESPEEFVATTWDGARFGALAPHLASLTSSLSVLAEQHQAYPILHYYRAGSREKAGARAVAIFDDALAIFEDAVVKEYQPEPAGLRSARRTVSSYLQTLRSDYIGPADQPLPRPDLDKLREADVPVVSDERFATALEKHSERRRLLLGYLQKDGWGYRSSS